MILHGRPRVGNGTYRLGRGKNNRSPGVVSLLPVLTCTSRYVQNSIRTTDTVARVIKYITTCSYIYIAWNAWRTIYAVTYTIGRSRFLFKNLNGHDLFCALGFLRGTHGGPDSSKSHKTNIFFFFFLFALWVYLPAPRENLGLGVKRPPLDGLVCRLCRFSALLFRRRDNMGVLCTHVRR